MKMSQGNKVCRHFFKRNEPSWFTVWWIRILATIRRIAFVEAVILDAEITVIGTFAYIFQVQKHIWRSHLPPLWIPLHWNQINRGLHEWKIKIPTQLTEILHQLAVGREIEYKTDLISNLLRQRQQESTLKVLKPPTWIKLTKTKIHNSTQTIIDELGITKTIIDYWLGIR